MYSNPRSNYYYLPFPLQAATPVYQPAMMRPAMPYQSVHQGYWCPIQPAYYPVTASVGQGQAPYITQSITAPQAMQFAPLKLIHQQIPCHQTLDSESQSDLKQETRISENLYKEKDLEPHQQQISEVSSSKKVPLSNQEIVQQIKESINTDEVIVELVQGEDIETVDFLKDFQMPTLKSFRQFKYFNPKSSRWCQLFTCDFVSTHACNKQFKKWHNLCDHLRIHQKEKPFVCPVLGCTSSYSQKSNLNKHLSVHKKRCEFVCQVCRENFLNKNKLVDHFRIHSKEDVEQALAAALQAKEAQAQEQA